MVPRQRSINPECHGQPEKTAKIEMAPRSQIGSGFALLSPPTPHVMQSFNESGSQRQSRPLPGFTLCDLRIALFQADNRLTKPDGMRP
jgi:hypothetical protein